MQKSRFSLNNDAGSDLNYLSTRNQRRFAVIQPESKLWLISFTDVMALMLTFFVLIFSMINPERDVMAQIANTFNQGTKMGDIDNAGRVAADAGERQAVSEGTDLRYLYLLLKENLENDAALTGVVLNQTSDSILIKLPQSLLFDSGSFSLKTDVGNSLAGVFSALNGLENDIEIRGYSDPEPLSTERLDYKSNWGLAAQRAASVADVLYNSGYRRDVLLYGLQDGDADTDADEYDALRRVEISISADKT